MGFVTELHHFDIEDFVEFLGARGRGVDQSASRDPPLPEHVANFRLCALSMESKIIKAQPFFEKSEFLKIESLDS
ncbi:unnamed protein product [Prunus brigantina]